MANREPIVSRALELAENFLAASRDELTQFADSDLEQLGAAATALRSLAADRTNGGTAAEHIA